MDTGAGGICAADLAGDTTTLAFSAIPLEPFSRLPLVVAALIHQGPTASFLSPLSPL